MTINTKHLGLIEYDEANIIAFPKGIPGFDEEKSFIIVLSGEPTLPFHYLQSTHTPEVAFVITDPFMFVENYDFDVPEEAVSALSIDTIEAVSVYVIATIPENVEKTTINLAAPIVINHHLNKGMQVLLQEDGAIRYSVFQNDKKGEGSC